MFLWTAREKLTQYSALLHALKTSAPLINSAGQDGGPPPATMQCWVATLVDKLDELQDQLQPAVQMLLAVPPEVKGGNKP